MVGDTSQLQNEFRICYMEVLGLLCICMVCRCMETFFTVLLLLTIISVFVIELR